MLTCHGYTWVTYGIGAMGIHTTWYLAEEGHEVVLAEGEHLDVLYQDKLVEVLAKYGVLDGVFD